MNAHLLCVDIGSHVDSHIRGAWFVELGRTLQRPTDSLCGKHSNNWKKPKHSAYVSVKWQRAELNLIQTYQIVRSHSPSLITFITSSYNHSWGEEMIDLVLTVKPQNIEVDADHMQILFQCRFQWKFWFMGMRWSWKVWAMLRWLCSDKNLPL